MTFLNTRAPKGHVLCRHLRAKEMYYTSLVRGPDDDSLVTNDEDDRHHYWCLRTCRQLGPDNVRLGLDACGPERKCYQGDGPLA